MNALRKLCLIFIMIGRWSKSPGRGISDKFKDKAKPSNLMERGSFPSRYSELALAAFVVSLVTFIAHFVFFPFFGLYEDDYLLTLPTMSWSWHDFTNSLVNSWSHPVFARPLNFFLRGIIFFFTIHGGHLAAGYLLSWILVSVNGILYSPWSGESCLAPQL